MQEHVHTGVVNVLFVGVAWLVFYNLLKYAAIKLDDYPQGEWLSRLIGSSISSNGVGA